MNWWEVLLIAVGAFVLGAVIGWAGTLIYIGQGMWQ